MLNSNVEYYNKNADSFFEGSINADMSYTRDKFMSFLPDIMKKMRIALKKDGVIYTSFKYGNGTKLRGERRFSDFNEKSVIPLFEAAGFEIIHNEIGTDSRPGRESEKWINVIGRRQ